MIEDPLGFARRICSRVALSVEARKDKLLNRSKRVQNTNNDEFVEAMTSRGHSRPGHRVRVGRWRETLSERQARAVVRIVSEANRHLGYDLEIRG
ncbi:MAG: hypothetical protein CL933_26215 [Deltaproteobacteria bacterium]|nr:hypothetical protein [Deltaproteobacteria bacterium]